MIRFYLKRRDDGLYVQSIIPYPTYGQRAEVVPWPTKGQAHRALERLCSLGHVTKDEIKIVKVQKHTAARPVLDRRCQVFQDGTGTVLMQFRAIPGYAALEPAEARVVAREIMALVSVPWDGP